MNALSHEYRLSEIAVPTKVASGLDAIVDRAVGWIRRRNSVSATLRAEAQHIDSLENNFRHQSDAALKSFLGECRQEVRRRGRNGRVPLPEALAAIREAAFRTTGLRPFIVQLMGALALRRGYLAEMATGEGKTLVAALAAVVPGWTRRPCHIVTVNDYLAQRDAEWLAPLYQFCGLSVGHVTGPMNPTERAWGYSQDITYTTSKEITADFLRDRLRLGTLHLPARRMIRRLIQPGQSSLRGLVMRGLHTAVVDEADSVLIDEAVTPLIISGRENEEGFADLYRTAWEFALTLQRDVDYRVNLRYHEVELLPTGLEKIEEQHLNLPIIWTGWSRLRELVQQALTARELFHEGKQYVVDNGQVIIVDEYTGRLMPMRRWRDGLHQMIEAKQGVEVSPRDETLARISFQQFFRFFRHLSGMTGTGREAAPEFWNIYRLPVITVPTNRPCVRQELPDQMFPRAELKWDAVVEEIRRLHIQGRPILVGTRSVAASELLAARLSALGLGFSLLNATRHREEAAIVARAGSRSQITIATNMAGRGTDIRLDPGVADLGGLHVLATERHESRRIDRQLYGRAGRQGDPGSAQAFVSMEDELIQRFVPRPVWRPLSRTGKRQGTGIEALTATAALNYAQFVAQRQAFRQRRQVLKFDTWLSESLSFAGSAQRV